jgi:integrative and conjugative element protein (TIGR02256 family)
MYLEAEVGQSGQKLILLPAVLAHLLHHQQRGLKFAEAGGQLFGRTQDQCILIEEATGPRMVDGRSRYRYRPNRRREQAEIDEKFRMGLRFFGDWHTHPEPIPKPSTTDILSMQDCYRRSIHQLGAFVLLIVGTSQLPQAIHGSLYNGRQVLELRFRLSADIVPTEFGPISSR